MADGLFAITKAIGSLLAAGAAGPLGPVDLPEDRITASPAPRAGIVEYADGSEAGRVGRRGESLSSASLPTLFRKAIVASEDAHFYEHAGVDPAGIVRAVAGMVLGGRISGASTIVQQTVKNTIIGNDRSLSRKVAEAVLAIRLAERMGREDILSLYLDSIYFGRGAHGAAGAARAWFDKDWKDLSIGETAFIAGVIKAPSRLDPLEEPVRAKERRDYVLGRMAETGVISRQVADAEIAKPLVAAPSRPSTDTEDWVDISVKNGWPADIVPVRGAGGEATIRTTLSADWQGIVEEDLNDYLAANFPGLPLGWVNLGDGLGPDDWTKAKGLASVLPSGLLYAIVTDAKGKSVKIALPGQPGESRSKLEKPRGTYRAGDVVLVAKQEDVGEPDPKGRDAKPEVLTYVDETPPAIQGAAVAMDNSTGAILGIAGGYDAGLSQFDRSLARRQPGSATKPFLYLAALDDGMEYDQMVLDVPISIRAGQEIWNPENYGGKSGGAVPLYVALEESSNLVAARLGAEIGTEKFATVAEAAGVWKPGTMRRTPSAVLGTSEVSLVDLTAGFSAIANGGTSVTPHVVSSIQGAGMSWAFKAHAGVRIASEKNVHLMQAILRGVAKRGTARLAFSDHKVAVAGKTGTTQEYRDGWFVGFVPGVTIGVWLGRDDNSSLPRGMTGGSSAAFLAARIFGDANEADLLPDAGKDWPPKLLSMSETAEAEPETDIDDTARLILEDLANNPPRDTDIYSYQDPSLPEGYDRVLPNGYEGSRGSRKRHDGNLVFTSPW